MLTDFQRSSWIKKLFFFYPKFWNGVHWCINQSETVTVCFSLTYCTNSELVQNSSKKNRSRELSSCWRHFQELQPRAFRGLMRSFVNKREHKWFFFSFHGLGSKVTLLAGRKAARIAYGHEMNLLKIQISVTARQARASDATRIVRNAYYTRWIKHCPTVVAVNLPWNW